MEYNCTYSKLEDIQHVNPNPRNANDHSQKQIELLAKIIEYQGFRHPIVVSSRSNLVVAGHARLQAAIHLGLDKVPVDEQVFESQEQENAFMVSDNAIAELASANAELIKELALEFDDTFELELLGIPGLDLEPIKDVINIEALGEKELKNRCPSCKHEW